MVLPNAHDHRDAPLVVFDAVVFVQAAMNSDGPAYAALLACRDGRARLAVSNDIMAEVEEVLRRPKLRTKNPSLTNMAAGKIVNLIAESVRLLVDPPRVWSLPRDPKDEPYINLAIAAEADYLVSRDKDLLDLMDESTPDGAGFRARFRG